MITQRSIVPLWVMAQIPTVWEVDSDVSTKTAHEKKKFYQPDRNKATAGIRLWGSEVFP